MSSLQTNHGNFVQPYNFSTESVSFQAVLPRPDENEAEMKLELEKDVKISFTFADYKLVVPWTVIYDSNKGVALHTIRFTFYHGGVSSSFPIHIF